MKKRFFGYDMVQVDLIVETLTAENKNLNLLLKDYAERLQAQGEEIEQLREVLNSFGKEGIK